MKEQAMTEKHKSIEQEAERWIDLNGIFQIGEREVKMATAAYIAGRSASDEAKDKEIENLRITIQGFIDRDVKHITARVEANKIIQELVVAIQRMNENLILGNAPEAFKIGQETLLNNQQVKETEPYLEAKDSRIRELEEALQLAYNWAEFTGVQSLDIFVNAKNILNKNQ